MPQVMSHLFSVLMCVVAAVSAEGLDNTITITRTATPTITVELPSGSRTVTPTMSTSLSTTESSAGSESKHTVTPEITLTPEEMWVDVYFEVDSNSLTPEALVALLRRVLWNNTEVEMKSHIDVQFPWIHLSFFSDLRADEAVSAANAGELQGVLSATYKIPVQPPGDNGNDFPVVTVVVVVVVVVVVLVVAAVLVYCVLFQKKNTHRRRYDEDYAMNCATAPVDLNEVLLTRVDTDFTEIGDGISNMKYYQKRPSL
ncbi:hypothetical protein DQ04_00181180 [Trypanosoma grayi]|uniref:hypothetical protein n=1 Tax=Trypanosoma grayi TaxID=71804 RepID=UPI0004F4A160|nr:hypothetical protein DQ04_00181180 [Trypanosoma grayi]KEG15125.1 hypothetical protein DQ04_00181180 [Trypanosoma grayi]